ncbi:MAG: class I SAM-dependent methyltransferase [Pseudomonadota bacterium]
MSLPIDIDSVKGFLHPEEGQALLESAATLDSPRPAVEIGSYCGKSTVYFGVGCQQAGRKLFAVDHHQGSEEHQAGEFFHDTSLADGSGGINSFDAFRATMRAALLTDTVLPVVTESVIFADAWTLPVAMLFIDGGHSLAAAMADYRAWAGKIEQGGLLAIHDVFPNAEDGGQAPATVYRLAIASGLFKERDSVHSLRILERL